MADLVPHLQSYQDLLARLKSQIRTAQVHAAVAVNQELDYMQAFAEAWPDESILQAPLAKLTWYHNLTLLEKMKSSEERIVIDSVERPFAN
jgi:hypothetical protein